MPETETIYSELLEDRRDPDRGMLSMFRFLCVLLLVFCVLLFVFTQVLIGVQVCGPSMNPTLYGGELASDGTYRGGDYLFVYAFASPDYGDIVVFHSDEENEELIKRVIGLPGDTITARNGVLYRTSAEGDTVTVDEPYIADGWHGYIQPYTVPEGCIYVMGDNRNNSLDSRIFGAVEQDSVLGVVTGWSLACKEFLSDLFGLFRIAS